MKNHNDTASVPEVPTIKDLNQATPDAVSYTHLLRTVSL